MKNTNAQKSVTNVVQAFIHNRPAIAGATESTGKRLKYHGHVIAEWDREAVVVTTAGHPTQTTKERLNRIPGVKVSTANGRLTLNGLRWTGQHTRLYGIRRQARSRRSRRPRRS